MQYQEILIQDDLDGSADATTVQFGIDGVNYEIDLNEKHAAALRKALNRYVEAGRRVSGKSRKRASAGRSRKASDAASVRDWARSQGHEVPSRGRIPREIREAYDAA